MLAVLFVLLGSACSVIPGLGGAQAAGTAEPTQNALTPTPEMNSFQQAPVQACKVGSLKSIATTADQGKLFAWSPDGKQIAYITPAGMHTMYSGELVVASAGDFLPSAPLAANVTGSVTWSPSGQRIAFVVLRPADNVYTVMVAEPGASAVTDLFPGKKAQMDAYSSPKAILAWSVEDHLRVQAACGDGCVKVLEVSVPGGVTSDLPTPEPTQEKANWIAPRHEVKYDDKIYPVGMNTPNWSNDNSRVVYFDQNGFLWVALVPEKQAFQLEMDESALPVWLADTYNRETVWAGNNLLGVRVGSILDIFQLPCRE